MATMRPPPPTMAPSSISPSSHPRTDTVMPSSADAGNSVTVGDFTITSRKLPILNATEIDAMTAKLGIAPPEMIFGNNSVSIAHKDGFKIEFNALDALDLVDKTGTELKVAYSGEWQKSREEKHEGIKEVVKPFDWTYTTAYTGSMSSTSPIWTETDEAIPLDRLRKPDPIIFFDDVMLYEDELADNGMSMVSVKIRVMPARLLLLSRFYMRLDDVLFRIRDTRVFVEFEDKLVLREYTVREDSFENVKRKIAPYRDDIPAIMRDSNQISDLLPIIDGKREKLVLV